jgi:8-oxo-dGTP diphosphatase
MMTIAAGVLIRNGRLLIAKKIELGDVIDKWELPGGRLQPGEGPEQGLKRHLKEKFGIIIKVGELFSENVHEYGSNDMKLMAFKIDWDGNEKDILWHTELCWVDLDKIGHYDFTLPNIPIIEELLNKMDDKRR